MCAQRLAGHYAYLPDIIETLREMRKSLELDSEQRHRIAGGLAKLVTDHGSFAEGVLGRRLMELANDFANE
jgi:hypothetical protein